MPFLRSSTSTVSYTHLRAHETSLHLVCRLLLEKKNMQDLKMEVETIKKSQRETNLEMENLGKKSGAIDASITNRIHEIEERIYCAENFIENIDTTVKENKKCKSS